MVNYINIDRFLISRSKKFTGYKIPLWIFIWPCYFCHLVWFRHWGLGLARDWPSWDLIVDHLKSIPKRRYVLSPTLLLTQQLVCCDTLYASSINIACQIESYGLLCIRIATLNKFMPYTQPILRLNLLGICLRNILSFWGSQLFFDRRIISRNNWLVSVLALPLLLFRLFKLLHLHLV